VRMQALLETLLGVNVHTSQQVAFAVGVDPVDILTSGRATDVGHRTQVTLPLAGRGITSLRVDPDDALDVELLSQSGSIAEELSARLIARFRRLAAICPLEATFSGPTSTSLPTSGGRSVGFVSSKALALRPPARAGCGQGLCVAEGWPARSRYTLGPGVSRRAASRTGGTSPAGGACGVISPLTSQGWRWTGG
jgi:hypothetical protein